MCAIVVELRPRRAGGADPADDLLAQLDHHAAAEEHHMWEFGERRDRVLALGVLGQSERVVAKRDSRIGFVVCAIERVDAGAVAAQGCDRGAVGIEHDRGFVVALPRTGRDHFARRLGRERGGNAMRKGPVR